MHVSCRETASGAEYHYLVQVESRSPTRETADPCSRSLFVSCESPTICCGMGKAFSTFNEDPVFYIVRYCIPYSTEFNSPKTWQTDTDLVHQIR